MYNYLFYKGYQLAVKSGNFQGMLVLGAMIFVLPCVMFNLFAVSLVLERWGWIDVNFETKYNYLFTLALLTFMIAFYTYKGRHQRIVKRYDSRERVLGWGIHPILVFILYYGISFLLLLLAGLYRNGNWIFR